MVVCKFFLQGNCRFGENCKFEHQINDGRQQHSSVLRQQNFNVNTTQTNPVNTIDTNTLVRAVINDSTTAEKGGQWLLSCYAPFKEKPNFPGFEEQSFEEIRWGYYEAQCLGTADQFKQQLQMSLQSAIMKLRSLQNPSPEIINTITSIYNTAPSGSIATNSASNPSSVFGNNQSSVFNNQPNSIFGQPSNFVNTNIFNQQDPSAKSIFVAANQKLFSNTQPQQNSIFANNQAINGNAFGSTIFGQQPTSFVQQQEQQQQPGIASFNTVPQSNGFFNTQQGGTSIFNVQNATPAFNPQQQNAALPFSIQQNNPQFNSQPQNNSSFFNTPQNTTVFNAIQQNTNTPFNTFGIQQPGSVFPQQQPNLPFVSETNTFVNNTQLLNSTSATHSNSIFGSAQTTVINNDLNVVKDESNYSKLENLSEEDIKSYESDRFEFGKIPEKPPTFEMCF